ncbi:MAG: hypothetical protein N2378_15820 [Chloroflexaceae bacterium]|nr:hypothetical protein [Chloroflexaceae bacterium]
MHRSNAWLGGVAGGRVERLEDAPFAARRNRNAGGALLYRRRGRGSRRVVCPGSRVHTLARDTSACPDNS